MIHVLLLPLFFKLAWAEPTQKPKYSLSLKEALDAGMKYSYEVKLAEAITRAADSQFRKAESYILPSINLTGSAGTQKNSVAYRSGFFARLEQNLETYRAQLELNQPLYRGGAVSSGIAASQLTREKSKQNLFLARQNYAQTIIQGYLETLNSQRILEVTRDNRDVLKSFAEVTARYARIGRSKRIDQLNAEASYQMAEAELTAAENAFARAIENLSIITGITWSREDLGAEDVRLTTDVPLQPVDPGKIDDLYQRAIETNPSIQWHKLEIDRLRYAQRAEIGDSYFPQLDLRGTYGYDSPDRPNMFEKEAETHSISLNLTIPLFRGFRSFADRSINAEVLAQAKRNLEIEQRVLMLVIAKAHVSLQKSFDRLKLTENAATNGRKAMDIALKDYRSGLVSILDVQQIQGTRFRAEKDNLNAQLAYHLQVLELRQSLGSNLETLYGQL